MDTQLVIFEETRAVASATGATLHLTVSGARLFTGVAALEQAEELRRLVNGFAAIDIAPSNVELARVQAWTHKGIFGTTSTASYGVEVACGVDRVPEAIDVATAHGQCTLDDIHWRYEGAALARADAAAKAIAHGLAKAERIAAACGKRQVVLVGCSELEPAPTHHVEVGLGAALPGRYRQSSVASALGDLALAPRRTFDVRLKLDLTCS